MEKAERLAQGKIVLATVKGDVHDIGKNLVEIILANNGYQVVNLGIKVPPEELVEAYQKHKPDAIGLSGLLVKSAQQMVTTAQDLKAAGIDGSDPGGRRGAVGELHAHKIAPGYAAAVYAKDAMSGLDLADRFHAGEEARPVREAESREAAFGRLAGAGPNRKNPLFTTAVIRRLRDRRRRLERPTLRARVLARPRSARGLGTF